MAHQPMGSGGLDVDMITGRPRPITPEARKNGAIARHQEAVQGAIGLAAELQSSPVLRVLFNQCRDRLIHLATKDEVFMAHAKTIGVLRHELEVAPLLAEQEVFRIMGPQMASFMREEEVAPEGIPTSK
jgi:hypothetical protein